MQPKMGIPGEVDHQASNPLFDAHTSWRWTPDCAAFPTEAVTSQNSPCFELRHRAKSDALPRKQGALRDSPWPPGRLGNIH